MAGLHTTNSRLLVLLVEDDPFDAELVKRSLSQGGMDAELVVISNEEDYVRELQSRLFDVILSDHSLPRFSSVKALSLLNRIRPDIPFILVTGAMSDEFAVSILKEGATDYLLKSNLSRLPVAINAAIQQKEAIRKKNDAEKELRLSEQKYKVLFENNPMPMWMLSRKTLNVIDVNEAAINHYGYPREVFMQLNAVDLRPAEDVEQYLAHVKKEMAAGTRSSGVWRHMKANGDVIFVDIFASDFIYADEPVRLVLANDVTDKMHGRKMLEESYAEIRRLADHLQNVREEERVSMAREIHDVLGQMLTALRFDISMVRTNVKEDQHREKLSDAVTMIDDIIKTVRKIATQLRPLLLDDMGLGAAIEWQNTEFSQRTGIECRFYEECSDALTDLNRDVAIGLFRIFQEVLTNISRHAKATYVHTVLSCNEHYIMLNIRDNGRGFDPQEVKKKKTLGILGMKERVLSMNGHMQLDSMPGEGTTVAIKVKR
ncbi:hybrid sensor histidine kinase/response regulator [Sediminibacterium ginsengisoli]|uniref:Two-component system, NarL family, sensor histidine kinase UhpB n=1 Tax=Sediminibacterium ginsengisoli TaxID=413434 RepID=A0A1T4MNT3_9BACT|nr:response regulator [Sediminibacterium ginsengisoli]SJZ68699.1 two-component system, NarL family, sensor histidine kinase UhpB [Sediminibacterium ginsengisoli]